MKCLTWTPPETWRQACVDELPSHHDNGTWTLVDRPADASVIKGRWLFNVKTTADGTPQRFKARWVAKGFTERHGINYDEKYASVVKSGSIKTFPLIAASKDWEARQFDGKPAFRNAPLDREVFVEQRHATGPRSVAFKRHCTVSSSHHVRPTVRDPGWSPAQPNIANPCGASVWYTAR